MSNTSLLLNALQHGDSFFPSGAASFSWGLEALCEDGTVTNAEDVSQFVIAQVVHRWACFDRGALVAAYRAKADLQTLADIDAQVNAQTLSLKMREGSTRTGASILSVYTKLGHSSASSYQELIRNGEAFGHLTVMQGFLWAMCGLPEREAEVLSAHTLCVGLLGAALRLGAIGHIEAQSILSSTHPVISEVLQKPAPALDEWRAFTPMTEISVMRHEVADSRLFAN